MYQLPNNKRDRIHCTYTQPNRAQPNRTTKNNLYLFSALADFFFFFITICAALLHLRFSSSNFLVIRYTVCVCVCMFSSYNILSSSLIVSLYCVFVIVIPLLFVSFAHWANIVSLCFVFFFLLCTLCSFSSLLHLFCQFGAFLVSSNSFSRPDSLGYLHVGCMLGFQFQFHFQLLSYDFLFG